MKLIIEESKISRVRARIIEEESYGSENYHLQGTVRTPLGIVEVWSWGHKLEGKEDKYSKFTFVHKGHAYYGSYPNHLTARGLARKAHEFAKRVVYGE